MFHISFCLLLPVCQASQVSTVSITSMTVQATTARMVACVWMVWTPTTASVHLITQVTFYHENNHWLLLSNFKIKFKKSTKKLSVDFPSHCAYAPFFFFQVSTARKMWTSVSWCLTHAKMEEHATTLTAATTASASTGGRVMTAARTSTTVPVQLVTTALPATTA